MRKKNFFNGLVLNLFSLDRNHCHKKDFFFFSKAIIAKQEHLNTCSWGCTLHRTGYFKSPLVLRHRGGSYSSPSRLDSSNSLGYSALWPSAVSLFFIKLLIGLKGGKRALHRKPAQVTSTVITYGRCFSSHGDRQTVGSGQTLCQGLLIGQTAAATIKRSESLCS